MNISQLAYYTKWKAFFTNISSGEVFGGFHKDFDTEPTEEMLAEAVVLRLAERKLADMHGHYVVRVEKLTIIYKKGVMPTGNIITEEDIREFKYREEQRIWREARANNNNNNKPSTET